MENSRAIGPAESRIMGRLGIARHDRRAGNGFITTAQRNKSLQRHALVKDHLQVSLVRSHIRDGLLRIERVLKFQGHLRAPGNAGKCKPALRIGNGQGYVQSLQFKKRNAHLHGFGNREGSNADIPHRVPALILDLPGNGGSGNRGQFQARGPVSRGDVKMHAGPSTSRRRHKNPRAPVILPFNGKRTVRGDGAFDHRCTEPGLNKNTRTDHCRSRTARDSTGKSGIRPTGPGHA
ncbi:MAG: hypothetical protein BWY09_02143 [Candidatus Hydrogenedentes bacterium ADurb.Bin179]|nr:MAG: hypothetical protein BWY09_02143 [Candidatus Hydrogenedentes bacterium ADurb.Bin179]